MADDRELRATSDKMLAMLERVLDLEKAKRRMEIGSDHFVTTADEVERLSRMVLRWSQLQLEQAREAQREGPRPSAITDVAPRPLDKILADWREAQLRLEGAFPGSSESDAAAADVARLREEYRTAQRAHD